MCILFASLYYNGAQKTKKPVIVWSQALSSSSKTQIDQKTTKLNQLNHLKSSAFDRQNRKWFHLKAKNT